MPIFLQFINLLQLQSAEVFWAIDYHTHTHTHTFIGKIGGLWVNKSVLKKNGQSGGISLWDIKTYHKAIAGKMIDNWCKNTHTGQWKRIASSEKDQYMLQTDI